MQRGTKGQEGIWGSNRNICCDSGDSYMVMYIFLNSSSCMLKIVTFYCI